MLTTYASAEAVRGTRALSVGATRVWSELHDLAVHVAKTRQHATTPSHIVFHLPAVLLAAAVGYGERHLYRLANELQVAGLIAERGHVAQIGKLRRYDGTLWAIAMTPTAPPPRLRWWDFRHDWRPDFAADYHGQQGAWREVEQTVSEPLTPEQKCERLQDLCKAWAAATRTTKNPAGGGSDTGRAASLSAVADALPGLVELHPRQRHREVSRLAADLADALNEPGRYRQHCRAIYAALQAENELRPGISALALQLLRLATDLAEQAPWRRPGALLAARLRPTS